MTTAAPKTSGIGPRLVLRLLATSDVHAHILPWDDLTDKPAPDRGLAQVASLVAEARAEVPGSLLLDNGDFLNGSPLADHVAERMLRDPHTEHPVIAAMNRMGYDAATLGNHEFSNGLGVLRAALAQARFPVVATNLDRLARSGRRPFLPRSCLITRDLPDQTGQTHRLTIGVLGFLPPQTALWERRHMDGRLATRGILEAARAAVPRLRRAGADVVVALSHSGLGHHEGAEPAENVSCALAMMDGIDAVIAGHTHQTYPATATDTPGLAMVMPGFFGSHLGEIDLSLSRKAGRWQVTGHKARLRPVSRRQGPQGAVVALSTPDSGMANLAAASIAAMRAHAEQPVGRSNVALQSYFALLGHSPVQNLLATAQADNMRRAIADLPEAALPMLVAVAPFKAGGRGGPANYTAIPPGPLTTRNMTDLYIHPNSPVALRITAKQVAAWLERAVSLFHQIAPGSQDACLVNADFPAYNFDMIHGVSCLIDLSQPPRHDSTGQVINPDARRVTKLRHQGRPLPPDQEFLLVTNSYRASGGAGFAGTEPACVVMEESRPLRRVLQDYVSRVGLIAPVSGAEWRFLPQPGTTVLFDTAPEAAPFASQIPGLTALDLQPTGFQRFRLAL